MPFLVVGCCCGRGRGKEASIQTWRVRYGTFLVRLPRQRHSKCCDNIVSSLSALLRCWWHSINAVVLRAVLEHRANKELQPGQVLS